MQDVSMQNNLGLASIKDNDLMDCSKSKLKKEVSDNLNNFALLEEQFEKAKESTKTKSPTGETDESIEFELFMFKQFKLSIASLQSLYNYLE